MKHIPRSHVRFTRPSHASKVASRTYPSIAPLSSTMNHALTLPKNDYFDVLMKVDSVVLCTTTHNAISDYDVACTWGSLNST
jgi:hypothetical protein